MAGNPAKTRTRPGPRRLAAPPEAALPAAAELVEPEGETRGSGSALALVARALEQLALLVLAHLLAPFLDDAAHDPILRRRADCARARGVEYRPPRSPSTHAPWTSIAPGTSPRPRSRPNQ